MKKMIRKPLLFLGCAAVLASLSGCLATSREIVDLRDDIHELQLKLNEMHRNQADLSVKMDSLNTTMGTLNSELHETQNRMSLMGQRLDDVDSNFSERMNKLSERMSGASLSISPPPSELYRLAYSDFSRGKYELAVVGFRSYVDKYPQGELAAKASYYIGECYYSQNEWEKALEEFKQLEVNYPHSDLVPSSVLKQALCLELMGDASETRELLNAVIRKYPGSAESFTAQEKLKMHQTDGK